MEFDLACAGMQLDCGAIEAAIGAVDPSAMVDVAPEGDRLRISTVLGADDVVALVRRAGHPVAVSQLRRLPSVCCGGCSG